MLQRPVIVLALIAVALAAVSLADPSHHRRSRERSDRSDRNSRESHHNEHAAADRKRHHRRFTSGNHHTDGNEMDANTNNLNENIIKIKVPKQRKHFDRHDSVETTTTSTTTSSTTTPFTPPPTACGHTKYLNAGELPGSISLQQKLGIVGGQDAREDEFPWQAIVIFNATLIGGGGVDGFPWQCGASVISEDYLLTTATCCMMGGNVTLTYNPPGTVYYGVRAFGSPKTYNPWNSDPITPPSDYAEARKVFAMMVPDRQYAAALSLVGLAYNNDFCIIQVDTPVKFDTWRIQPICLPQSCDGTCKVGDEVYVSGGGDTGYFLNETFAVPNTIKYVKTKILDKLRCQRQMDATRLSFSQLITASILPGRKKRQVGELFDLIGEDPRRFVIIELLLQLIDNPSEICFSGRDAQNFGTSFGDEGGPAACLNQLGYYSLDYMQTVNRLLTVIVALISEDPTCGDPTKLPGVIAGVCDFVPWIKSVTGLTFSPIPNPISPVKYLDVNATAAPYQCGHSQYWNSGEAFETFAPLFSPQSLGISGGVTAKMHEFPWQVVIKNCLGSFCGGVVIAPEWILTSGDCCAKFQVATAPVAAGRLAIGGFKPTVYYGVTDFNYDSGNPDFEPTSAFSSKVCDYYFADNGILPSMRYWGNLCLVKVKTPATFNTWKIQPICLPKNCLSDNTCTPKDTLVISGFGQTTSVPNYPATLQSATVTLENFAKCRQEIYANVGINSVYNLAWADIGCYNADAAATRCGDEGGPMSCFKQGYHQLDYLQTADKTLTPTPAVSFTARVCLHMPWIRGVTGYTFDEDTIW